jgi:NADPH2:quinone reductase
MPYSVRVHAVGGPEALVYEEIAAPVPGPGEVLLRQHAIGVNYIDIYHRNGLYKLPNYPVTIGSEGAGEVIGVGSDVVRLKVGDRVAYAGPIGAYAEVRVIPENRLVKLPDGIDYETAASIMMRGMTTRYLLRQTYPVDASTTLLFHAAAGGVGLIACQWARALGVTMIGTVSTDAKAEMARAHGCAHTIVTSRENIAERVREITSGKGVPVVYDSVGKDTLMASLDSLQPRGTLISNGTSSGPVVIDTMLLAVKGSLWVTRPAMIHYAMPRAHMLAMAKELFDLVLAGKIRSEPNQSFALADAAEAHRALESRKTVGATVLVP